MLCSFDGKNVQIRNALLNLIFNLQTDRATWSILIYSFYRIPKEMCLNGCEPSKLKVFILSIPDTGKPAIKSRITFYKSTGTDLTYGWCSLARTLFG